MNQEEAVCENCGETKREHGPHCRACIVEALQSVGAPGCNIIDAVMTLPAFQEAASTYPDPLADFAEELRQMYAKLRAAEKHEAELEEVLKRVTVERNYWRAQAEEGRAERGQLFKRLERADNDAAVFFARAEKAEGQLRALGIASDDVITRVAKAIADANQHGATYRKQAHAALDAFWEGRADE